MEGQTPYIGPRAYGRFNGEKVKAKITSVRPKRDDTIGDDDVLNLKIALGTCETIDDFIEEV